MAVYSKFSYDVRGQAKQAKEFNIKRHHHFDERVKCQDSFC